MGNKKVDYKQIEGSVRRLYEARKRKEQVDKYYDEVRKKEQISISNFMYSCIPYEDSFDITLTEGEEYYASHKKLHVTKVRRKKVTWYIDKLKEVLPKNIYNSIIRKKYVVEDMDGLIKYLKSCGVEPKKFKKHIRCENSVNETVFNNLYEIGEINLENVKGCYDVEMSEPYIRITEAKEYGTEV